MPRFCSKVSVFKKFINCGPYYICVVCNRCLYRRSVGLFNRNKFSVISDDVFSVVSPFDGNLHMQDLWEEIEQKLNSMPSSLQYA